MILYHYQAMVFSCYCETSLAFLCCLSDSSWWVLYQLEQRNLEQSPLLTLNGMYNEQEITFVTVGLFLTAAELSLPDRYTIARPIVYLGPISRVTNMRRLNMSE